MRPLKVQNGQEGLPPLCQLRRCWRAASRGLFPIALSIAAAFPYSGDGDERVPTRNHTRLFGTSTARYRTILANASDYPIGPRGARCSRRSRSRRAPDCLPMRPQRAGRRTRKLTSRTLCGTRRAGRRRDRAAEHPNRPTALLPVRPHSHSSDGRRLVSG